MKRLTAWNGIDTGLGLASNTYKQVLMSGEMTIKELICWAAGRGFSWVEVRDPDVTMTRDELEGIKRLADSLKIRIHYSWDNKDTLKEDETFYQGMENAALFGPGTCCRVLIAQETVRGRKGYSKEEVEKILLVVEKYVKRSKELGIWLCFENSMEPIRGDGVEYFGMSELLEKCQEMCVTFDAANATNCTTCINPTEEQLLEYYNRFSERIFYFHLKVTKNHQLLDTVEREGDFHVENLFQAFSSNKDMKICLEIPQQPDLRKMTAAVERSLEVLEEIQKQQDADQCCS